MLSSLNRSTNNPHWGNYCATWDPWTDNSYGTTIGIGDVSYGNTSNFDIAEALQGKTQLYARYWMRWEENIDFSEGGKHKIFYCNLKDRGDFVLVIERSNTANFHILGKSQSPYELRENKWLSHSGGSLDDMEWHKIEVFMDWSGTGATGTFWVKIDDIELINQNNWYFRDSDESGDDVQLIGIPSNVSGATPGTAVEWFDDIEIWDGMPESPGDTTPPADVTNFTAEPGNGQVTLSWINPTDSDFKGTMISYSTGDDPYPVTHNEGTLVCDREAALGSGDSFTVTGLVNDIKYNFSAFTYDEAGNYSETAHVTATPTEGGSGGTPSTPDGLELN